MSGKILHAHATFEASSSDNITFRPRDTIEFELDPEHFDPETGELSPEGKSFLHDEALEWFWGFVEVWIDELKVEVKDEETGEILEEIEVGDLY